LFALRSLPKPRGRRFAGLFIGAVLALSVVETARADCRLELELIGTDLKGVRLTEQQKLQLAPLIDDAQKRCRFGREAAAQQYLAQARKLAGIVRKDDDLDSPARSR
jgi:hypothetical protein